MPTPSLKRRPGRPKTQPPEIRRQRILDSAGELFIREGYATTNMARIAEHCGMSKRTLYEMFASKDALFAALVCDVDNEPAELSLWDKNRSSEEALTASLLHLAEWVLEPRQIGLSRLVIAEALHSPDLAAQFREQALGHGRRVLSEHLRALPKFQRSAAHSVEELASILIGAVVGDLQLRALAGEDIQKYREPSGLAKRVREIVRRILGSAR